MANNKKLSPTIFEVDLQDIVESSIQRDDEAKHIVELLIAKACLIAKINYDGPSSWDQAIIRFVKHYLEELKD